MKKIILPPTHPYLYETHLHTVRGSACSTATPKDLVDVHLAAGYTGVVITEHNWGGYTAIASYLNWVEWVNEFTRSFYEAKKYGEKLGLDVFWGYEAGFNAIEFLVLGLTPEFLLNQRDLRRTSMEEHYRIVKKAGGLVVHAHPYREAYYIPKARPLPQFADAVEGINATHHNRYFTANHRFDEKAIEYANRHDLPLTAGSDTHGTRLTHGGMAFKKRPKDEKELIKLITAGNDYLLTDGVIWYDSKGIKLSKVDYLRTSV